MNEKRFVYEEEHFPIAFQQIRDTLTDKIYDLEDVCELLNKKETIILNLKLRLEKINGGYGHLTHKKGLTVNEWLLNKQERELKKKDEQISNWIEQHSKDIIKISEQQATINKLKEECDALQKKTEMDKNDFFISEAKRMRLLAFIEDNGLRKEYYEWERRIWDE